jgi:hypothetical protein
MTTPAPPLVDEGNALLAEAPAQCSTGLVQTPAGQRLALTVRTPSTTLTVLLGQADAKVWAANISTAAAQMSAAGLIVAGPGQVVNGNGAQP